MTTLSQEERVHHFQKAKVPEGTIEAAPWQPLYSGTEDYDERDDLRQLQGRVADMHRRAEDLCLQRNVVPRAPLAVFAALRLVHGLSEELKTTIHQHAQVVHKLRCQVFVANAATAPIKRLSDAILAHIFGFMVDTLRYEPASVDSISDETPETHESRPSQIILASVCRRWRAVAHSSGQLWSKILYDDLLPKDALEEWLRRGGDTSLDLTVIVRQCNKRWIERHIRLIDRVSHRLRTLKVVGHAKFLCELAHQWESQSPHFSRLDVQRLGGKCHHNKTVSKTWLPEILSLSALEALSISNIVPPMQLSKHPTQVTSTLRHLTINFGRKMTHFEPIHSLLQLTPNLEVLDFQLCQFESKFNGEGHDHAVRSILLRHLKLLKVRQRSALNWGWLTTLDTPALERVQMWPGVGWQAWLPAWRMPAKAPHPLSIMGFTKLKVVQKSSVMYLLCTSLLESFTTRQPSEMRKYESLRRPIPFA